MIVADGQARFANMQALKELARVLQPAGVLGMIWNIDDCRSTSAPTLDETYPVIRQRSTRMGHPRRMGSKDA